MASSPCTPRCRRFLIFWLPWIAFDLAASALLCRGRATLWDGTYSLLLTLEIFARAARVVVSLTPSTFKVTPKDGIDDGGWRALRQLHLVLGIGAVLLSALVLRGVGGGRRGPPAASGWGAIRHRHGAGVLGAGARRCGVGQGQSAATAPPPLPNAD